MIRTLTLGGCGLIWEEMRPLKASLVGKKGHSWRVQQSTGNQLVPLGNCFRSKYDSLDCREAMILAEVAINPHRQGAAVLVAKPATHCRYINAGLNAGGRKEVTKVVMGEAGISPRFSRA